MLQLMRAEDRITVRDDELAGVVNGDKDTSYVLKPLTREVYRQTIRARTKKVPNARTHQMEDRPDWAAIAEDLLDYTVESWQGVLVAGEPAPCDRERKLMLDPTRAASLLDAAGLSQVQAAVEDRTASFR